MAHNLDKHYNNFAGVDTRQNKLLSNPKSFRAGSKNFRYNFQDEIQKANGFQHKSIYGFTSVGDIEYRYTDLNTGAAKVQYLAVGTDGILYKKRFQYLKFSGLGTATSYSFYYDDVADDYKFKFNSYSAITVSTTMTMDDLRVAINAQGPTCAVVDEDETTVSGSTKLAYLLDVVIGQELSTGVITVANTQYWESVLYPSQNTSSPEVPFVTTKDFYTNSNYRGVSYVNMNNVCYITDGGFPMKYDGYTISRMGMPKVLQPDSAAGENNFSDFSLSNTTESYAGQLDPNAEYQYVFQYGNVDFQGAETVGTYEVGNVNEYIKTTTKTGSTNYNSVEINYKGLGSNFPVFSCKVNGAQNIDDAGGSIDVDAGHNIKEGMLLRIPLDNSFAGFRDGYSFIQSKVSSSYKGASIAGTTTAGSTNIGSLSSTSNIAVGCLVTGPRLPSGYSGPGAVVSGSPGITIVGTNDNIGVGARVFGTGIPVGATVVSNIPVMGFSVITISANATADASYFTVEGARVVSIDNATNITVTTEAKSSGTDTQEFLGLIDVELGYGPTTPPSYQTYPFQEPAIDLTSSRTSGSASVTVTANYTISGTMTNGSNVISGLASTSDLRVGMWIRHSTATHAAAQIIEITSASSVKMSVNAGSTATANIGFTYDVVGKSVLGGDISEGVTVSSQDGMTLVFSALCETTTSGVLYYLDYPTLLVDNQIINAGYAAAYHENIISNPNDTSPWLPGINFGAFLRVYRTKGGEDEFYRLIELPIENSSATTAFVDMQSDTTGTVFTNAGLSSETLVGSDQGSELPRACKYISQWQNQVVQMGRPVDTTISEDAYPTAYAGPILNAWGYEDDGYRSYVYGEIALCDYQSIYWADALSPEGFPVDGTHEFKISSNFDDQITGGIQNKDAFFAFKERSTGVLTGSLADNNLSLELLEDDIGCASHRSIQEVNGSIIWLDAVNGFYSCVAGRLPVNIGFPISDYQKINSTGLDWYKAVSGNFRKENLYVCAVEGTTFVFDYANEGSLTRNCWYIWDRFNTKSMIAQSNDELYLSDGTYQWKMKVTNTKYDFTDHKTAIDMVVNTAWITLGEPIIDKQFTNLWVNSIQGDFTLDFYQYQNYLDYSISELTGVSFLAESYSKKLVKVPFKAAIPKMSGVSFGMRNNVKNAYVRIQGFEIEFSASYDKVEPRK